MLKAVVRFAAVFIALFMAFGAALYVTVSQDAFPQRADYSINMNFQKSTESKPSAIRDLNAIASRSRAYIAKIAPDPTHFYSVRNLFVFGATSRDSDRSIKWLAPGLTGRELPASRLGTTSLDGPYVVRGSDAAVASLETWAKAHAVTTDVTTRSVKSLLMVSLVTTGGWLAVVTGLVLVISLVITWYAMRARQRTLRLIAGQSRPQILWNDLSSLLLTIAVPVILTTAAVTIVVAVARGLSNATELLAAIAPGILSVFVLLVLTSGIVGALSFPRIDAIASRVPTELPFRIASESVRILAVILALLFLPSVSATAAHAFSLSADNARWAPLSRDVSLRLAPMGEKALEKTFGAFGELAEAADTRGSLDFSYQLDGILDPSSQATYDGIVLVNPSYLAKMGPAAGKTPSAGHPLGQDGHPVRLSDLSPTLRSSLTENFALWTAVKAPPSQLPSGVRLFQYESTQKLPAIDPNGNTLSFLSRPLVIVVDKPSATFNGNFLNAVMSTSNVLFSDPTWLDSYLKDHAVGRSLTFVDRVADVALNKSQAAFRQAIVTVASMLIVLLALVMATAVATRIRALVNARRIFTQRSNGWKWGRILRGRLVVELTCVAVLTVGASALATVSLGLSGAWMLLAFPIYGSVLALFHLRESRLVFDNVASRRA